MFIDVGLWNKNMGQKWRKIRRRCSSFNTGTSKAKAGDDRGECDFGAGQDRGPLISAASSSDDSTTSMSSPPRASNSVVSAAATTVHDILRARLNMLNIGGGGGGGGCGNKRRHHPQQAHPRRNITAADASSTFYVPSPLLRAVGGHDGGAGPCSLPVTFDVHLSTAADQRLVQPASLCRVAETPSSCCSSGRGTADDGAGSDRSSVSYSDHGYNSIVSTATGYDAADRLVFFFFLVFSAFVARPQCVLV